MNAPAVKKIFTPELSIILVNWHTYELVEDCLQSLNQTVITDHDCIVVDNSQSEEGRRRWRAMPPSMTRWILNDQNVGFAQAMNQGISASTGKFILLINPDCRAEPGTIDAMHQAMEDVPKLGLLGCGLRNTDGSPQTSWYSIFPSLGGVLLDITGGLALWRNLARHRRYVREAPFRRVAWAKDACLMTRRALVETIGGLDERFFLYCQDADWCYRARRAGWIVGVLPGWSVVHHGGMSSGHDRARSLGYYYDAYLKFILKHAGPGPCRMRERLARALLRSAAASRLVAYAIAAVIRPKFRPTANAFRRLLLARERPFNP